MANNIRKIRKLLNLTPKQMAEKLNCSVTHIYTLESGKQSLSEMWENKLSKLFCCETKYLYEDFDNFEFLSRRITQNFTNSIINQNQSNCTNYNNTQISQQNQNNINLPNITCLTDEMEPSIHINDILYYDENDKNITTQKKIFIITNTSGDDFIRTIYKNMDGKIIVEAENEKYKSLTRYNLDGFVIKGRVVYILKNV